MSEEQGSTAVTPAVKKAFDLSALNVKALADEGVEVQIYHPTDNTPTDIYIKVMGRDSLRFKEVTGRQNKRKLNRMSKGGGFRPSAISLEELEADAIELLIELTVSWRGVELDGVPLECTVENCKRVYTEWVWLREQVDAAVADRANFLKKSSAG